MSFLLLSAELRHEIYSYLVFETPEPPTEPPIIHIDQQLGHIRGRSHTHCCRKLAAPKRIYQHFLHKMADPIQTRGSMLVEYGTNRPFLSTPNAKSNEQSELCLGFPHSDRTAHGWTHKPLLGPLGHNINALLRTSRWLADDVRSWMYPRIMFDFQTGEATSFGAFTAGLMPWTRRQVRMLRLSVPIYSFEAVDRRRLESYTGDPTSPYRLEDREISRGFEWKKTIQNDVVEMFPNVHTVHVILVHQSRRLGMSGALAAPVQDVEWREEALEAVLKFSGLALKEVTVVVDNRYPVNEIWSGDPRIGQRRELAEWLRQRLLRE